MKRIQMRCPCSTSSNDHEPEPATLPTSWQRYLEYFPFHIEPQQTNDYFDNPRAVSTTPNYQPRPTTTFHKSQTTITTHLHPHLEPYTTNPQMKRNNVIILILFLAAIFLALFAWFLHTTCRRIVSAEVHEMLYQRDVEAQKSVGEDGKMT